MGLTVQYLTEEELSELDPTGCAYRDLRRFTDSAPTPMPPIARKYDIDGWFAQYLKAREKWGMNAAEDQYDQAHFSKFGRQGYGFSLDKMKDQYRLFYLAAEKPRKFDLARIGSDYLCRRIRAIAKRVGISQPLAGFGVTGTNAALPTMMRKGDFLAETIGANPYRHVYPDYPGQRHMRQKPRVINQDSVLNVRYIESELSAVKRWLVGNLPCYFSGWMNPSLYLQPQLHHHMQRDFVSIETDFEHCDEHTSLEEVVEIVLPVYEELLPPAAYFKLHSFTEELFNQPIFFGNELWTGLHDLFSGQVIANDYETVYDICVVLGGLLFKGIHPRNCFIVANGDDITVIVHVGMKDAHSLLETLIGEFESNGHVMSKEKCTVSSNSVRFCRRLYSNKGPILYNIYGQPYRAGFYPHVLSLMNTVAPERHWHTTGQLLTATLQRLDVNFGASSFVPFVQFLGKRLDWSAFETTHLDDVYVDWWDRLYGERWCATKSKALEILRRSKLVKF